MFVFLIHEPCFLLRLNNRSGGIHIRWRHYSLMRRKRHINYQNTYVGTSIEQHMRALHTAQDMTKDNKFIRLYYGIQDDTTYVRGKKTIKIKVITQG